MRNILIAALFAFLVTPAFAAESVPQTFGVVDMNKIMQTTDAAKDVFAQLEAKRKEYQAQITKEEDTLRAAEQSLLAQKDKMSKEELEKKRREFDGKVLDGQKLVQDRKRILDQAFNSSMNKLRTEAASVVAEVAKERNYSAVLTQDAVMLSIPALDMTDVVTERMNARLKTLKVEWTAPPAAEKK